VFYPECALLAIRLIGLNTIAGLTRSDKGLSVPAFLTDLLRLLGLVVIAVTVLVAIPCLVQPWTGNLLLALHT